MIVRDGFLDVDEELSEMLEMDFPSKILCREDCRGLCPKCGANRNHGSCSCPEKEVDPRLAPLAKLLEKYKAEGEPKDEQ